MLAQKFRLLITVTFLLNTAPAWSQTEMSKAVSQIFDGPPRASEALSPQVYVETSVQKLAKPEILYVNWSAFSTLLKQMGYAQPPTHLTPELAQAVLDKAGFAR